MRFPRRPWAARFQIHAFSGASRFLTMNCISTLVHAFHIASGPKGPIIRTVSPSSADVSTYMIAAKASGLPPMVLVVDSEALCKFSSGMPAPAAIHSITAWAKHHLPSEYLAEEGTTWVCMNGTSSFSILLLDRQGIVTWRKVKWPQERQGSLASFIRAFPHYSDAFIRVLDAMNKPLERFAEDA